jgi:ADP-heptose:LPS heptosyltransferase
MIKTTRLARFIDPLHRLRRRLSRRSTPSKGILLVSAGGLGDTVLFSIIAERFARLAQTDEPVTVLLRRDGAKTAFCLPEGIDVETVDFGLLNSSPSYRWQAFERLFKANYRLVVSTDFLRHPFLDEALIIAAEALESFAMVARPWQKYQTDLDANQKLYTRVFDSGAARRDKVVRWNDFANWLSGGDEQPPKVQFGKTNRGAMMQPTGREIIIQPFSAVAAKQLDARHYNTLIDALPDEMSIRITGLASDLDANPKFNNIIEKQNVTFDSSTFEEISPHLAAAALVISVDTAMMHLAAALGAPTLCLASAAYVDEIVPYDAQICPNNVCFIYQKMPCEGCLGDCIHSLIDGRYPCIDALTSEMVVSKALEMIQSSSKSQS